MSWYEVFKPLVPEGMGFERWWTQEMMPTIDNLLTDEEYFSKVVDNSQNDSVE